MMNFPRQLQLSVGAGTLIYLLFGAGWIIGRYFVSESLYSQGETPLFELFKGLVFVAITGLLVFALLNMRKSYSSDNLTPEIENSTDFTRWQNIRQRGYWWLVTAVVVFVLAIFFVVSFGLELNRQGSLRYEQRDARAKVDLVSAQIGKSLRTIDLILQQAVENRLQNVAAPDEKLQSLQRTTDEFVRAIWLLDKDGIIVQGSDTGNIGTDLSGGEYFLHHTMAQETGLVIGESTISPSLGTPFVSVSRAVRGENGEFLGVAFAALDQKRFINFWQLHADGLIIGITLLKDSEVLLTNSASQLLAGSTLEFSALRGTDTSEVLTITEVNGDLRLVGLSGIDAFPGLQVAIQIPLNDLAEGWRTLNYVSLLGFFGIAVLLFGLLNRLINQFRTSESLARKMATLARYPLDNINPVMRISAAGDYEFLNPSAGRLLESLEGTQALDQLQAELLRITKQLRTGTSEFRFHDLTMQISSISIDNGDCDFYLTDVTANRREESILKLFYEMPFIGMAVTSSKTQEWIRVNDRLCEILGYSRSELTALTWTEITHPDDLAADLVNFNRVMAGETEGYRTDKRFIRPDSSIIYASIDARVVRDQAGEADFFVATVQDITELKHSENALRLQKNLYAALSVTNHAIARSTTRDEIFNRVCQAAVENAGFLFAWIGEMNTVNGSLNPVAAFGNDNGYIENLRVSINEMSPVGNGPTGRAVRELKDYVVFDVEQDDSVTPWKSDLLKRGVTAFASFPIANAAGVFGSFNVYASSADYFADDAVSLMEELTFDLGFALEHLSFEQARTRNQALLASSEARFRDAIDDAPFPILIHAEDGEVLNCNKIWLEITGYTKQELATLGDWARLAYGENQDIVMEEIYPLYNVSGRKDEGEFLVRCKNGEMRTWEFSSVPLGPVADGRKTVMSMASDVTDRKRSLTELAEAEEKFRHLVEQPLAGIFMADEENLIYGNPRTAEILGYPYSEIEDISLDQIVALKDLPAVTKEINEVISGEKTRAQMDFDPGQNSRDKVRVGAQGSRTMHRGRALVLGVMQDIYEKERADEKIADYTEQIRSALLGTIDVVRSIGEMRDPYTAGHELGKL